MCTVLTYTHLQLHQSNNQHAKEPCKHCRRKGDSPAINKNGGATAAHCATTLIDPVLGDFMASDVCESALMR
jgi:hypothetical protein